MRTIPAFVVCAAVAVVAIGGAHATSLLPKDLDELAAEAEVIAVGRCAEVRSDWNEGRTLIYTWATYEVESSVGPGLAPERITVRALGGTVGPISQAVVDGPRFEVGERDLLLLGGSDEPGVYQLVGLTHGKIPIVPHPRTGEDRAVLGPWILTGDPPETGQARPPSPGTRIEPLEAIMKKVVASQAAHP